MHYLTRGAVSRLPPPPAPVMNYLVQATRQAIVHGTHSGAACIMLWSLRRSKEPRLPTDANPTSSPGKKVVKITNSRPDDLEGFLNVRLPPHEDHLQSLCKDQHLFCSLPLCCPAYPCTKSLPCSIKLITHENTVVPSHWRAIPSRLPPAADWQIPGRLPARQRTKYVGVRSARHTWSSQRATTSPS